jgi:hypothetical protein
MQFHRKCFDKPALRLALDAIVFVNEFASFQPWDSGFAS